MRDWDLITTGHSDAMVRRSPDGRSYAKTASRPAALAELADERDRLMWLSTMSVGAPRVLDWDERDGSATMVTSALHGIPASSVSSAEARTAVQGIVAFLGSLHAIAVRECPFDRRLEVTTALAAANVTAGLVDEDDFDEERRGDTADQLLIRLLADRGRAEALEHSDLAVCHGDFCLPNVLLDPDTLTVTGILDVGRLGIADRHLDIALLTRSMSATDLNPGYGPELSGWVREQTNADPWRIEYYRLLDEFF
ncbi:aminoglycoside 3'-phosphotransferase [Nocardia terpenica]|uniref:APH(3') family aminoglycoside O-phosphotransferase n=1 Tax=Nocardia terpenica TaxID=455432 RepID=UPI00189529BB|nr:APH(3') family aminoglycoside O-phosphotransferase [Nocardia terpenica]MBF6059952.1 aminoglycoside 3'-phosphotransferase [Nocardia terpenica]MBF6102507.1 aminoglycoside 3'-phosphotransferase [Nocardia terpenica]MBF6111302.1 aminoglycoside 3'-phosphotransferase [Nocardia terpenica]MBF6117433.1 aminoglycoside 3'-phosphotransferase [Nocardia terpenica]MBF6150726.1 aminoglycoside 3'-phosphotransferase [Nocardia terpenica]